MRCRKVRKRLSAFLDGEVGEMVKERIALHLEGCSSCGNDARALSSLSLLLKEGRESIKPSPYFWNKLEQRIAQTEENQSVFGKLLDRLGKAFIPATATAILLVGLFIGTQLGGAVYSSIAKKLNPESFSLVQKDVDQSLYLNSLDDFPGESLGGIYNALLTETKSP